MKIKVLLVDDHKLMREGLTALLDEAPDIEIVGGSDDGRQAMAMVASLRPDVVVMDVGMPGMNGIEATRWIRHEHERTQVVALSTHADDRYVQHMLEAGACGYVLKIGAHGELLRAVRAAATGKTFLSPEIAAAVVERAKHPRPASESSAFSVLGAREREVLQLVTEGRTSGEIAASMHISPKTVETHRRNITKKLGLNGTAKLTKYALREGLTQLEA